MSKLLTKYICQSCGAEHSRWQGKCAQCNEWSTLVETIEQKNSSIKKERIERGSLQKLLEVEEQKIPRLKTGITEFDRVLGGGIVSGSLVLIGGDPGIGKSTLILQMAEKIASVAGQKVLYASGEESANQIKLRAVRLGSIAENLFVVPETNIEAIIQSAQKEAATLLVVDSIQTMFSEELAGAAGSVGQVSLCTSKLMDFAKKNHIPTFIVGHVTKEGSIAGPKILEHLVDTVLYLEGDKLSEFRILRGVKNRFGSTNETGVFEMDESGLKEVLNPSEMLLNEKTNAPGSIVYAAMEGTRPLLVEVQALTNQTSFGFPKRTASGFDLNRLNLLVAVLAKRAGLNLGNQDIYVNVVGGIKISEPALDLAVCLAIASSYKNKSLSGDVCAFGEVGLAGEIRQVSNEKERLKEAEKLGYKRCFSPTNSKNVRDVISKTLT